MATLSQLLADQALGLRLVQSAPEDPQLSWVSTTELLRLADYLEGGELVLTTGVSLGAEDPRWRDFVAGLSRARIAAIGFGVGVAHERIPAPLVAAASDYRMALVEVPPPTPFIAVSKAASNLLRADEMRAARQALQAHQRLIEGARSSSDSASVLASIAQATGRQLALQVRSGGGGVISASTAGYAVAADRDPEAVESVPLDHEQRARILVAPGPQLGPEAQAVVAAGAMVLGMNFRGDLAEHEEERERWSRLTVALLHDQVAAGAAQVLDPSVALSGQFRALAVQGASEQVAAWRRVPRQGPQRLVSAGTPREDGVSLAWHLCPADDTSLRAAHDLAAAHGLDVAVGRAAPLGKLMLSKNSAATLVSTLSRTATLYASPRVPRVLFAEHATPLLEALLGGEPRSIESAHGTGGLPAASAVLGPLAAEEIAAEDGADPRIKADEFFALRDTLRTLLEHNGQRTPTAVRLGVHRNTLRDRITRIEQLTGRSLDDPDARAELWLALRIEEQRVTLQRPPKN